MGNSDEKPEKPIEDEEQNKKQEDMKKKKSEPYPVINSGRGQKPGNKNSNNPSDLKNKKGKDKKNSPPLENIDNIQNHGKKIVDTLINNSKKQSIVFDDKEEQDRDEDDEDEDNQFMPMLALPKTGSTPLVIKLITLTPQKNPRPCVRRNSSQYKTIMNWKMHESNTFQFSIQGQPMKLDVDLQGNVLNKQYDIWALLCPLDILFNQRIRVGQYKCSHYYLKLSKNQQDSQQEQEISPSMKKIQLGLDDELFRKWDEKIPQHMLKKGKKVQKIQPFAQYKQLSRYFDNGNNWKAGVYIEETYKQMKIWMIQLDDPKSNEKLSKLLQTDIGNRQESYILTMHKKLNPI